MIHDVLAWDNLCDAWNDVQRAGAGPGVDDVTVWRWGRQWEANLIALREAVRRNSYRPAPLRRYAIPKPDGGERSIACLTVSDKVLQRAALNVLDAHYDPTFLACSYGYRKGRSVADALQIICTWRDAGYRQVLDADIDACFDSLDHGVIRGLLRRTLSDPVLLGLVDQWLVQGRRDPERAVGIPLGAVISPLLCNLVLHQLDLALLRDSWRLVRYADDFVVLCQEPDEVQQAWARTVEALEPLRLRLEPTKTAATSFAQGFDFLGVHFEGDQGSYWWDGRRYTLTDQYPPEYLHHRLGYI